MKKLRLYAVAKAVLGPVLKLTMRVKVVNPENEYSGERGCVVCANHTHMFDCVVLAIAFCRMQLRFLAKKELFSVPLLKNLIEGFGAYGVDRGGADVGAVKKTIAMLSDGAAVGIFPQGTRYPGVEIEDTKFKSGAVMAAYHAHVPLQPVAINVKNRRYRFLRKKTVIIGAPISWEELGFREGEHPDYAKATAIVKERIIALDRTFTEAQK